MRIALFIAALSITATPVVALASTEPAPTTIVKHDDLDLTTQKGISRLDDRLQNTIRKMCDSGARDSASKRMERQCRTTAFASAEQFKRQAIAAANTKKVQLAQAIPVAPEV